MLSRPRSLISNENDKVLIDDGKTLRQHQGLARKGPGQPRSVLGAPLILANKDLQGGHVKGSIVMAISRKPR